MTWLEAFDFIKEMNSSRRFGYKGWRLPNRRELFSLVSQDNVNPSLVAGHPFVNVFNGYYWTSTSVSRLPDQAWYVHMGGGRIFKGMKHGSYMVWPVRNMDNNTSKLFQTGQRFCYNEKGAVIPCNETGQDGELQSGRPPNKRRFSEDGHLVNDNLTGLTWTKSAFLGYRLMDWESALISIKKMNREEEYGYDDWRLPDIVELESLTDMGSYSPALPIDHPFDSVQEFYWSSTTSIYDTRYAWVFYAQDGALGVGYKPLAEFFVWAVRG